MHQLPITRRMLLTSAATGPIAAPVLTALAAAAAPSSPECMADLVPGAS